MKQILISRVIGKRNSKEKATLQKVVQAFESIHFI